jgi:hypothetical protein
LKLTIILILITLGLAAAVLTGKKAVELSGVTDDESQPAAPGTAAPVLVELFTSEGCSSCPPADELLARLEQTQPVAGAEIIALSEHVDYWNRLGWADPYSSAEFSERQNSYARAFDTDDIYTPQMIVDGRVQFVGSNRDRARQAITDASRAAKARVEISLRGATVDSANLAISISDLQSAWTGDSAEVLLAITESGLRSSVSRGENAGRSLHHTAVVRALSSLGSIDSQSKSFSAEPVVRIEEKWKRENLKAVVFVQERASRRVLGAAQISMMK